MRAGLLRYKYLFRIPLVLFLHFLATKYTANGVYRSLPGLEKNYSF